MSKKHKHHENQESGLIDEEESGMDFRQEEQPSGAKPEPLFKSGEVLANAEFVENKVIVWNRDEANRIYSEKYFGKWIEEEKVAYLQLSLEEAMLLLERAHIKVAESGKPLAAQEFYGRCVAVDKEFPHKFTVYRDLRNRGYIVKSGFKFGTHFRVYDRGVNPYKTGGKETKEHTKYNVHGYPENHVLTPQEWSRYVRLSHNIRATALMGVVDEEGDVTYYKIIRTKP